MHLYRTPSPHVDTGVFQEKATDVPHLFVYNIHAKFWNEVNHTWKGAGAYILEVDTNDGFMASVRYSDGGDLVFSMTAYNLARVGYRYPSAPKYRVEITLPRSRSSSRSKSQVWLLTLDDKDYPELDQLLDAAGGIMEWKGGLHRDTCFLG